MCAQVNGFSQHFVLLLLAFFLSRKGWLVESTSINMRNCRKEFVQLTASVCLFSGALNAIILSQLKINLKPSPCLSLVLFQPLQPHVRVWDSVTLQTLQIVGLGTFERGVGSLAFSKAVGF